MGGDDNIKPQGLALLSTCLSRFLKLLTSSLTDKVNNPEEVLQPPEEQEGLITPEDKEIHTVKMKTPLRKMWLWRRRKEKNEAEELEEEEEEEKHEEQGTRRGQVVLEQPAKD